MVRGINKTEIFSDAKDKKMFIERLGSAVIEGQYTHNLEEINI
jgi:hypothetical protein